MKVIYNKVAFVYLWGRRGYYLYMILGELLIYTERNLKTPVIKSLPHTVKKFKKKSV